MIAQCTDSVLLTYLYVSSPFNLVNLFVWLQDGGNTPGFSARGKRDDTAQSPSQPRTGVLLL